MPSSQLKRAVADAGPEMVAATSAALFATGQRLVAQDDPGSLLFAALAGSVLKDDDGLDRMLVYAVTEANPTQPPRRQGVHGHSARRGRRTERRAPTGTRPRRLPSEQAQAVTGTWLAPDRLPVRWGADPRTSGDTPSAENPQMTAGQQECLPTVS